VRDRLEAQLTEKYERRRQRLLLASVQTLEAMDRAIDASRGSDAAESLVSGVMLVRTQLFRILQEEGLERVSVLGLPFDPRSSEIVQRRPVSNLDQDGVVLEELQGGHQLRGHIIRRAKVVVGEYAEDVPEPTVVMSAFKDEPEPIEPTVAMPAIPDRPVAAIPPPKAVAPPVPPSKAAPPPVPPPKVATPPPVPPPKVATTTPIPPPRAATPPAIPAPKVAVPAPPAVPAPKVARPPAVPPPSPASESAEEPIVVEDWTEPTQAGTPSTLMGASAPPPLRPAPPPPPPDEDDDDSVNATMVLADSSSMFVRPAPPPVPPGPVAPAPVARGAAAAAPVEAAEATQWESVDQRSRSSDPRETQPVPRENRVAPATPPSRPLPRPATPTGTGSRLRTGAVPPPRARSTVIADVPTVPSAPAVPRPPAVARSTAPPRPPQGRGRGFYVGLGVVIFALLGALGVELWLLAHREPEVQPAQAPPEPTTLVAAPPTIPEEVTVVTTPTGEVVPTSAPSVAAGLAPSLAPGASVTTLPTPAAAPSVTVAAAPPTTAPAAATLPPRPPTAPPTIAPVANPIPGLLAQAEQAIAARRFDEAISRYNEVLKLEPQNPEATAGRLRALGDRASVGRYFLSGITMSEGKASGGGVPGFDDAAVVKSRCECALMYEVTPTNPVQGQPYSVAIFLRNDSKRDIKPQRLTVTVTVNGSSSNRPVTLTAKEVPRGQRVMVGKLDDTWKVGTTSWSLEAAVGAANTYRAQLTWELRVSGQ
jgi:hypothetical protein